MKTDELVALLSTNAGPAEARAVPRRFGSALGWGAFGATLLMAVSLGVRPDLSEAARMPMFWVKLAFPTAVAIASLYATARLSRPGVRLGDVPAALLAPFAALGVLATWTLITAEPGDRAGLLLGSTARYCLVYIPMVALPVLVAALWAMRGLAPTRPALAGGAAGLLAGGVGAMVYALHCTEMAPAFLSVFYATGMLIPGFVGAALGLRLLRW